MAAIVLLRLILVVSVDILFTAGLKTYYMDEMPSSDLFMDTEDIEAGRVKLSTWRFNLQRYHFVLRIHPPEGKNLMIRFLNINIRHSFLSCDDAYVRINQDYKYGLQGEKKCGYATPRGEYTSNGGPLEIEFKSNDLLNSGGFELLFTAYEDGTCSSDTFKCDNGRCIYKDLKCNGYNNCGDNSDTCALAVVVIVGIVIGCVGFAAIVIVVISYLCCRRRSRGTVIRTSQPAYPPVMTMTTVQGGQQGYMDQSYGASNPYYGK